MHLDGRHAGAALVIAAGLAMALYGAAGLASWARRAIMLLADDAGWFDGLGGAL